MGIAALVVVAVGLGGFFLLKSKESSTLSLAAACEKTALVVAEMRTMPSLDEVMAAGRPFDEKRNALVKVFEDRLLPSYAAARDLYSAVVADSSAPDDARQEAKSVTRAVDTAMAHVRETVQSVKSATSDSDLNAAIDDLDDFMSTLGDLESPAAEAYIDSNRACRDVLS